MAPPLSGATASRVVMAIGIRRRRARWMGQTKPPRCRGGSVISGGWLCLGDEARMNLAGRGVQTRRPRNIMTTRMMTKMSTMVPMPMYTMTSLCVGDDNNSSPFTAPSIPLFFTGSAMMEAVHEVPIRDDMIRLGQFLKLADLVDAGADAKPLLETGRVLVNDEIEVRRGRQLRPGDVVTVSGVQIRVTARG